MGAFDVTSLVPASVWNEVGKTCNHFGISTPATLWPTVAALEQSMKLNLRILVVGWLCTSAEAASLMCFALLLLLQGPTPGALQELLDSIDKHTEQVGSHSV
jgi:hypothetical protein